MDTPKRKTDEATQQKKCRDDILNRITIVHQSLAMRTPVTGSKPVDQAADSVPTVAI